jgi:hypothetical protein
VAELPNFQVAGRSPVRVLLKRATPLHGLKQTHRLNGQTAIYSDTQFRMTGCQFP